MITSPAGRKFIEEWEESGRPLLVARWDGLGHVWEIGYGHTSAAGPPRVQPYTTITADEADAILASDLSSVENNVNHLVKAPISQNQFDALVSFDFNTGGLARSALLRAINHSLPNIESDFLAWDHAGGRFVQGLYNRRLAEWKMFNSPVVTA